MLCMLFVERLRLFLCFRKHKGFLFSLRQCCNACARNVNPWGEAGRLIRLYGRSGHCFRFDLHQLLLPFCFLILWLYWTAWMRDTPSPSWSTMDLHFADRDTSVWEIFEVNQRISTFVQDAWWPNWSYWAVLSEQTWGNPSHFYTGFK